MLIKIINKMIVKVLDKTMQVLAIPIWIIAIFILAPIALLGWMKEFMSEGQDEE